MRESGWPTTSRQSRGYGATWDRLRRDILKRDHGLCQCDKCKGGALRVTVATEVHHIKSKAECERLGWTREQMDDPSNLAAVNKDCHKRATIIDKGARPKQRTGADGYPVDG